MISESHQLAKRIFSQYLDRNLADEGLFPETVRLAQEAVSVIADLLGSPTGVGQIVTGGTEANILALWSARERRRESSRRCSRADCGGKGSQRRNTRRTCGSWYNLI